MACSAWSSGFPPPSGSGLVPWSGEERRSAWNELNGTFFASRGSGVQIPSAPLGNLGQGHDGPGLFVFEDHLSLRCHPDRAGPGDTRRSQTDFPSSPDTCSNQLPGVSSGPAAGDGGQRCRARPAGGRIRAQTRTACSAGAAHRAFGGGLENRWARSSARTPRRQRTLKAAPGRPDRASTLVTPHSLAGSLSAGVSCWLFNQISQT